MKTFNFNSVNADTQSLVYQSTSSGTETTITIDASIFESSGNLRPVEQEEWNKEFVTVKRKEVLIDEDIPF